MKKSLLLSSLAMLVFGYASNAKADDFYQNFKKDLEEKTGITYNASVSLLGQRGAPSGKITPWQAQYYGDVNWNMFETKYGNGSMQASYTKIRYWGREGTELDNNLGVLSSVNGFTDNSYYFNQLSYTHEFVGMAEGWSATLGQYPLYMFDSNPYLANQQMNFDNLALTQNGSYDYPSASLGAYVSYTVGFQDANNISGEKVDFDTFGDGEYTSFVSLSYTPTIEGWGDGEYSLLVYNQPSVDEQPKESNGWSLNASQDINDKWAVFGRANGATHSSYIRQSYALGGAYLDPFNRQNSLDQLAFAVSVNKTNKKVAGHDARDMETVFEAYWNIAVGDYVLISPDFQMYIKPALERDTNIATVYSIRMTLLF